jgi:sepiapterin reductase
VLKNAVILVTGAGKGIGEAFVLNILGKNNEFPGLKLFLTSRTEADLAKLTALAMHAQVQCETLVADLAETPLAAFHACIKTYGRVDALIHCAGVGRFGSFLDLTEDDLQYVMKTNVRASFLLMQAVYAQMKNQSLPENGMRGQIQWVTSVAAEKPFEQSSIYCMSKYAQRGLIDVMREYARKDRIRILDIKPGATYTPMWGEVSDEQQKKMMGPNDIAIPMIAALLLSPRASLEVLTLRPIEGDL